MSDYIEPAMYVAFLIAAMLYTRGDSTQMAAGKRLSGRLRWRVMRRSNDATND